MTRDHNKTNSQTSTEFENLDFDYRRHTAKRISHSELNNTEWL